MASLISPDAERPVCAALLAAIPYRLAMAWITTGRPVLIPTIVDRPTISITEHLYL
jgi:hypothetical protein